MSNVDSPRPEGKTPMPPSYDTMPSWMTYLADAGIAIIILGVLALIVAMLPARLTMNMGAVTNRIIARPAYLMYLLVRREREPVHKHAA